MGRFAAFCCAGLLLCRDGTDVGLAFLTSVLLGATFILLESSSYDAWEARAKAEREGEEAKEAEVTVVTEVSTAPGIRAPETVFSSRGVESRLSRGGARTLYLGAELTSCLTFADNY